MKTDVHGNVIAQKKGSGKLKLMVVGHADEIGMMVHYIDDDGYIKFKPIGGIDASLLPGLRVNIYHDKKIIRGVIGKKPIHLMEASERKKVQKLDKLWIDIGAKDKEEAEKKVSIGDPITFNPGMEELNENIVTTKGTDNKAGVFVAGALLESLKDIETAVSVYAVASVQEEIGLRGAITSAYGINPDIGIAIDVTHASDYPFMSKDKLGEISLSKGPVIAVGPNINPQVFKMLKEAASELDLNYQLEAAPRGTGTDANAIQITRSGVAAGLISIPNRYMHTPSEIISLKDLDEAVQLLNKFAQKIDDKTDFIPKA